MMTRKARLRSKAEKAITPAQRIFFEHLNGSKPHPALEATTNAPQTQDRPRGLDRSFKLEEPSPISSQPNYRGRSPRGDYYQPYTSLPRGGDYWPPLNNSGIRSDFYRPSRRRSRSPVRYNETSRMRTPSRESRAKDVNPKDYHLHREDYRGQAIVHDHYQGRTASREPDMTRSKRCSNELNRRSYRYHSPSPLRALDTHHQEPNRPEDLRVTLIVHMPGCTGSINSS